MNQAIIQDLGSKQYYDKVNGWVDAEPAPEPVIRLRLTPNSDEFEFCDIVPFGKPNPFIARNLIIYIQDETGKWLYNLYYIATPVTSRTYLILGGLIAQGSFP